MSIHRPIPIDYNTKRLGSAELQFLMDKALEHVSSVDNFTIGNYLYGRYLENRLITVLSKLPYERIHVFRRTIRNVFKLWYDECLYHISITPDTN